MTKDKKEGKLILEPQEFLSPSSINEYLNCPRGYYYRYIAKIKPPSNEHLVKGSVVHKVLETFFTKYRANLKEHILKIYDDTLVSYDRQLRELELPPEKIEEIKKDCFNMIMEYYFSFSRQINSLIEANKAENQKHAYYLLKPKFRELYIEDDELKCRGYIDRVHEDWDGNLTIADYKTSSLYGLGLKDDYKRQLAIYSLLYKKLKGKQPDYAAVIFLRYGLIERLEVTPSLLTFAEDIIKDVYAKTRSTAMGDYPKGKKGSPCRWCPHDVTEKDLIDAGIKEKTKKGI